MLTLAFALVERRAADPILPLAMFSNRLVVGSLIVVFLVGTVMFGAIAFVPLFVQGVMGGSATEAGQTLTPLFLGWVTTSVLAARWTVRFGYRPITVLGVALLTVAFGALASLNANTSRVTILAAVLVLGCGLGLSMLALLLAIQHGVARSQLGIATSLNQFARSVGSAVGVALMGALLARGLAGVELPGGVGGLSAGAVTLEGAARVQFAAALARVFTAGAIMSAAALLASFFLPPVDFSHAVQPGAGEQMLTAEMATLEPEDEPMVLLD